MTAIDALHGRARVRRARRLRLGIVLLVLSAMFVLMLQQLAQIDAGLAAGLRWFGSVPGALIATFAGCIGGMIGGLLVDRFGLRASVGLVLVLWCGFTVLGAILDPVAYVRLAQLVGNLLPGMVLVFVLLALRLVLAPRRRGPAVAYLMIVHQAIYSPGAPSALYTLVFDRPDPEAPLSWQYPMFALATVGAGLAAFWLLTFPEVDAASALDLRPPPRRRLAAMAKDSVRLLAAAAVLSLIAIQLCGTVVDRSGLDQPTMLDLVRYGSVTTPALIASVGPIVAYLVAAAWSDWVYRRTRSFLKARRPFIVIGFLLAAIAPPAAVLFPRNEVAFTLLAAIGMGALGVGDLLVVDLAPRRLAGTFIGTVIAGQTTLVIGVNTLNALVMGRVRLGEMGVVAFAIAGAVLAALLMPLMRPEDDARRERGTGVSSHF